MQHNYLPQQRFNLPLYHSPKILSTKRAFYSPAKRSNSQQRQQLFGNAYLISSSKLKTKVNFLSPSQKYKEINRKDQEKLLKGPKPYKELQRDGKNTKHNHQVKNKKIEKVIQQIQKQKAAIQKKKQELLQERNNKKNVGFIIPQIFGLKPNVQMIFDSRQWKNIDSEYDHNIDPDRMTYEELLQLQEKIGVVSRGIHPHQISMIPKHQFKNLQKQQEQYKMQDFSQKRCTICFEYFQENQQMTVFKCKHSFHRECIKNWLLKEKKCPNCKQEIEFV